MTVVIGVQDCFLGIMEGSATDVAQQLGIQGADINMSIPIYEIFFIKIQSGDDCRELAQNIREYQAIRKLCKCAGAVQLKLNVCDLDILTLMGLLCIYTPSTGMHVFAKLGGPALDMITEGEAQALIQAAGLPLPDFMRDLPAIAMQALDIVFNMAIDMLSNNLADYNINLHQWEDFADYFNQVQQSGELNQMARFRFSNNLPQF